MARPRQERARWLSSVSHWDLNKIWLALGKLLWEVR